MKTYIYFHVLLIAVTSLWTGGCSTNGPRTSGIGTTHGDADIRSTLLKIEDEWAELDKIVGKDQKTAKAVLERIWAPDYVSTGRDNLVMNKHDSIAKYSDDGVESAVNSNMAVHIYADNVAVVTGIDNTKGKDPDGKEFDHQDLFTDTYVKRKGLWQCVASHTTRIK